MIDLIHYHIWYCASLFKSPPLLLLRMRPLDPHAPDPSRHGTSGHPSPALAPLVDITVDLFKLAHLRWIQWIHRQCQLKLKTSIPRLLALLIIPSSPVNLKTASDWHFHNYSISLPWLISGSAPATTSSVQSGFVRNTTRSALYRVVWVTMGSSNPS